jgi:hypothetical protein
MPRLALLFSITLIAYDALTAAIAKALAVSYDSFAVLALVLLFFMGIFAGRQARSWSGMLTIAIAAGVEATAGWYVAALIGPGFVPGWTMRGLIVMAIQEVLLSTLVGAVGVWVGLRVAGARRGLF